MTKPFTLLDTTAASSIENISRTFVKVVNETVEIGIYGLDETENYLVLAVFDEGEPLVLCEESFPNLGAAFDRMNRFLKDEYAID